MTAGGARAESRYLALDVLRGITIALMIVVNTPGNYEMTFAPLLHARWNGFTPTDWVFPTFMFVVGASLSLTLGKYQTERSLLAKLLRRTAIIFVLGYLMYWFPFVHREAGGWVGNPIGETRIFGVLQRIALGYGLAALIIHYGKDRGAILFSVVALLGYWGILTWFGDLTLTGNAVVRLDRAVMGEAHLYHGEGLAFDPEGILSTLPAIVNTIGGYFAGRFVRRQGAGWETIGRLMIPGVVLIAAALAWNPFLPINKKLWTGSFVLLTIGLDLLALALLVYWIDLEHRRRWTRFFEIFGTNALVVYLVSELGVTLLNTFRAGDRSLYQAIYQALFRPLAGDYFGSLAFALAWMGICWTVGWGLDRRGIHLRA
jgi:predicted acyltransferase